MILCSRRHCGSSIFGCFDWSCESCFSTVTTGNNRPGLVDEMPQVATMYRSSWSSGVTQQLKHSAAVRRSASTYTQLHLCLHSQSAAAAVRWACFLWHPAGDVAVAQSVRTWQTVLQEHYPKKAMATGTHSGQWWAKKEEVDGGRKRHVATWVENVFVLDVEINHVAQHPHWLYAFSWDSWTALPH